MTAMHPANLALSRIARRDLRLEPLAILAIILTAIPALIQHFGG